MSTPYTFLGHTRWTQDQPDPCHVAKLLLSCKSNVKESYDYHRFGAIQSIQRLFPTEINTRTVFCCVEHITLVFLDTTYALELKDLERGNNGGIYYKRRRFLRQDWRERVPTRMKNYKSIA